MSVRIKYIFTLLCIMIVCVHTDAQTHYSLQKALRITKENNPVLKTEQFNIGISEADLVTTRLRPNPTLNNQSLQLIGSRHFSENTRWHDGQNRQVWWQLTKPFQIAGQRSSKIETASKNILLTEKTYEETERGVLAEVAGKWLEVWAIQKQLDIIHAAQANIENLVEINQVRLKNQVITQTDLLRTELLVRQYVIESQTTRQELINKEKELGFLLGLPESAGVDTTDNLIFSFSSNADSLLTWSMSARSDIQVSKSLIEVAGSNIRLQKSLAIPQPEVGLIWNPQNTVPYFGIFAQIDLPVFSRNQGEVKKAYLLRDQAEKQLAVVQSRLQTEISTAYATYQLQKQNVKDFREVLEQSEAILSNVKYAYLKGGTTIIDFLEAQRSWLETRQQYYSYMEQYRKSYIQVLYTTGLINQLAQ